MPDVLLEQSRDPAVSESCTGRALVPLTLPQASEATPFFERLRAVISKRDRAFRPDARFVAHLIATAAHAPQTRALVGRHQTMSRRAIPVRPRPPAASRSHASPEEVKA